MRGHESITRALLSHGADVNKRGGLYGTALQAAAHRGHGTVVEILLDAGAGVYLEGFSRDAFHAASEGGHEGIVRLLFEMGYRLRQSLPSPLKRMAPPSRYRELLHDASPSRSSGMKPISNYQPVSRDWRGRASMTESDRVVGLIRGVVNTECGILQSYRDDNGKAYLHSNDKNYALSSAAAKGHFLVVELLLSQSGKLRISVPEIVAAFKEACRNGHEKVVAQLLSNRIDAKDFKAALEVAALKGHLKVVDFLIDREDSFGLARIESVRMRRPTAKVRITLKANKILDGRSRDRAPILAQRTVL